MFSIKLQIFVTAVAFDPSSMLITNQLAPIDINLYPAPQQNLWLYNPYTADIKLGLISGSAELSLANDEIVVQSRQRSPLLLTFAPKYVGSYEVKAALKYTKSDYTTAVMILYRTKL